MTAGVGWNLAGVDWSLLLYDYKAVHPFCDIFGLLKNSKLFQIPDLFVKGILQMYRNFPRCMSSGFCILFELEFVWHSWKLPYPSKNIRVDIKDVLLSQWTALKLARLLVPNLKLTRLLVPKTSKKTFAARSFSILEPTLWNALPTNIRKIDNYASFKKDLKTHLFKKAYKLT